MPLHGRIRLLIAALCCMGLLFTVSSVEASARADNTESVSVVVSEDDQSAVHVSVELNAFENQNVELNNEIYNHLTIDNEPTISMEGLPDLPFIARCFLVPPQSDVHLDVSEIDFYIENGIRPIPAPGMGNDGEVGFVGENAQFRNHEGFWPPQPVVVGSPAILRGYRLVTVHVFPFQYNPSTAETRVNNQVNFSLTFDGMGENIVENPDRPLRSIYAWRAVSNLVENPPPPPQRDELLSGSYLYIVPNVNGVDDAIAPLIEWRRRQGHRVAVETVQNNAGVGTVGDLISDYYESDDPVEFVAIVGDNDGGSINIRASNGTGDYNYSLQEGRDALPDVAVGRISVHDVNTLDRVVNKLVSYEADPHMDDTDWFKQGAVVAGYSGNGLGTVLVAKYVRKELLALDFTEVNHWYHTENGNIGGNQPWLQDQFDWGISVLHYRAYQAMNNLSPAVIDNLENRDGRWPAVLAISCNTGDFVGQDGRTEHFFRSRGGGIGAIGTATPGTRVQYNNIMAGGVWKGIYKDKLYAFGWGLNSGKYQLWRAYHGLDGGYANFLHWNNLMGDPGTHIWTDIPREIDVGHPRQIAAGESRVTVQVSDQEEEVEEPEALVCLYKEDEIHLTKYTDENGFTDFYIDPEALSRGDLLVTVTKHNVKTYLGEIDVVEPDFYLGASSWEIDDDNQGGSQGNDDESPNPGETIELTLTVTNFGDEVPDGQITVTMESLTPWSVVVSDPVELDEAPAVNQSAEASFIVEIDPACPDQTALRFGVEIESGQSLWQSMISLTAESPHLIINDLFLQGGEIDPGDICLLDIELRNNGHAALERCRATLVSDLGMLRVIESEAEYDPIAVNRRERIDEGRFRIRAHPFTIPGMQIPLNLTLETDGGFTETIGTMITIGEKDVDDPLGPDAYGYVCFDSGDEGWELTPVYDWIEIDPDVQGRDFRGTELNLRDGGDNDDHSMVVDLPFDFQYYGEVFDEITICTNGWAAFGNQEELADFRNRRIAQALGPNAQLCVWWDNLTKVNDSAILIHYDQNGGRFIIEWNNMQRNVQGGGGARETFEIILYDSEIHPTTTGDGMILFQYADVTNENRMARNDTPFCTIGIGNLDDSDGIEYTYWNTYPTGARRIEDEMALLFITESDFRTGAIEGTVTDVATGEPVTTAEVMTTRGFWAETDENGFYRIDDILVGDDYDVTARAQGWNDSTLTGFDIVEAETLTVNFGLLHPEFAPSVMEMGSALPQDESLEIPFTVDNPGNGPLTWSVSKELRGEVNADPWELRRSYSIGQSVQDDWICGALFIDEHFYVCGAGNEQKVIYIFDREGELVSSFPQFGNANRGMTDLTWDGELIWGSNERRVYGFTPDGELERSWNGPLNPNKNFAWDTDRELLWISSTTFDIHGYDRDGNAVAELDRLGLRVYGLAYWSEDPDGYNLYVFNVPAQGLQYIHKINTDNNDTMFVAALEPERGGRPNAASITNQFDIYSWVFIAVVNAPRDDGGDRIDIWQVDARKDWMQLDIEAGTLNPDNDQPFTLTLDATGLPEVLFEGDLVFTHNALGGETRLAVWLEVTAGAGRPDQRVLDFNTGWNMISLNIEMEERNIPAVMQPLVEDDLLTLMKDGEGHFYLPQEGFNNIPEWDVSNGYQVYVTDDTQLELNGLVVPLDRPIPLEEGWNLKAYYPRVEIEARVALAGISEQLIITKDCYGHFYLPEYDFSDMGNLREGQGYLFKVAEDVNLVYNAGDLAAAIMPSLSTLDPLQHFQPPNNSSDNMSVLVINSPELAGWELGVFNTEGKLAGASRFDSEGICGAAVWGSETVTGETDEMRSGQPLLFKLWDGNREWSASAISIQGKPTWSKDGIFVGELTCEDALPKEFGLVGAYPNPFNSAVRLRFGLTRAGAVRLTIYDQTGRQVAKVLERRFEVGYHSITWLAEGISSGIYIAKLEQENLRSVVKLMLMK